MQNLLFCNKYVMENILSTYYNYNLYENVGNQLNQHSIENVRNNSMNGIDMVEMIKSIIIKDWPNDNRVFCYTPISENPRFEIKDIGGDNLFLCYRIGHQMEVVLATEIVLDDIDEQLYVYFRNFRTPEDAHYSLRLLDYFTVDVKDFGPRMYIPFSDLTKDQQQKLFRNVINNYE